MGCVHCLEEDLWELGAVLCSQWQKYFSHMESLLSQGLDAFWSSSDRESPAYLNVLVVCVRDRHGFEATVLVADFCSQKVDDFLHLLHSLRNLLSPQVHLGVRRSGKQL